MVTLCAHIHASLHPTARKRPKFLWIEFVVILNSPSLSAFPIMPAQEEQNIEIQIFVREIEATKN